MRKILLLICLFLGVGRAFATHIVGGEFEMTQLTGNTFEFRLNLYFDRNQGLPGALDNFFDIAIFQKSNNALMARFTAPLSDSTQVSYTQPECAINELRTTNYQYRTTVQLPPAIYNHPAGYYVVAERCCRNNTINNIAGPGTTGQTFYLEFPPRVVDGVVFNNSSPKLFPPLSDYACVGNYFYYDFSGQDPDGDSLVYSLAPPLRGFSTQFNPKPLPVAGPYPQVTWLAPYNNGNQVSGPQPLQIDPTTGFLELTPNQTGLFVFAIRCAEFRDGVQIGVVQREFQLLVRDCPVNQPPALAVTPPGQTGFYNGADTIFIPAVGDRCFRLFLTDPDTNTRLTARVRPLNFSLDSPLLTGATGFVNSGNNPVDTLEFQLCFDSCFGAVDRPLLMDVIVQDNGCALPKTDTVRLTFIVEEPIHAPPVIALDGATAGDTLTLSFDVPFDFTVTGTDPEDETVILTGFGEGFAFAEVGMSFAGATGVGTASAAFSWTPSCQLAGQAFPLTFVVTDDNCVPKRDTVRLWLQLPDPGLLGPELTVEQTVPLASSLSNGDTLLLQLGDSVVFDVTAIDPDGGPTQLDATGFGFGLADVGMEFVNSSGDSLVSQTFRWEVACRNYERELYGVRFRARDLNCEVVGVDTLVVWFRLIPEENTAPVVLGALEANVLPDTVIAVVDEELRFAVTATDANGDSIRLVATGIGFPLAQTGMSFPEATGIGQVDGEFVWTPRCEQLNAFPYQLQFVVQDFACILPQRDTLLVWIQVVPPPNQAPVVRLDDPDVTALTVPANVPLQLPITVTDPDGQAVTLRLLTADRPAGVLFPTVAGDSLATGTLTWQPRCEDARPEPYILRFVGTDDPCGLPLRDTLTLALTVEYPNLLARVALTDQSDIANRFFAVQLLAGRDTVFDVLGLDADTSTLTLRAEGVGFDLEAYGMRFPQQRGRQQISSQFAWQTDCSFLRDAANPFVVRFVLEEFHCPTPRFDTLLVQFEIIDSADRAFTPPNVFTPNQDGVNDFYQLFNLDNPAATLPPDNCNDRFKSIAIYDRWGRQVFFDERRDFRWSADGTPDGTYYYLIRYEEKQFKGWITVLR